MTTELRLTLKENVVMRCIGLLLFLAPNTGGAFLGDVLVKTYGRLSEDQRRKIDKAMAA